MMLGLGRRELLAALLGFGLGVAAAFLFGYALVKVSP